MPRWCPAAFMAEIILPQRAVADGRNSEISPMPNDLVPLAPPVTPNPRRAAVTSLSVLSVPIRSITTMPGHHQTPGQYRTPGWRRLRLHLQSTAPSLYPPLPRPAGSRPSPLTPPPPAVPSVPATTAPSHPAPPRDCVVCRGPVRPGFARCYQCDGHDLLGRGLLADAVVPISYSIKGTAFAEHLWRYKSVPAHDPSARASLRALLLAFLADHGACVWRSAGLARPAGLAVVPTGAGRPGPHPLLGLVSPYLRLPACPLALRPGHQGRDLDLDRFRAGPVPPGVSVLLLDDTWVSGASAQSAAVALKLAGARHVAVVVLGRHVNPDDPASAPLLAALTPARYDPSACAAHRAENGANRR